MMKKLILRLLCLLLALLMTAGLMFVSAEEADLKAHRSLIAAGLHTVGVKADGTVVSVGYTRGGVAEVGGWTNVVAVAANTEHTVALRADGTVLATGYNDDGKCYVDSWEHVVSIAAGHYHTVAVHEDGTVVATGRNDDGQCDVTAWRNVVSVAAGESHTLGLLADGTVVAAGSNKEGQCDVAGWQNVVAVAACADHSAALLADGTVILAGKQASGMQDSANWRNMTAVALSGNLVIGLNQSGTVSVCGKDEYGLKQAHNWTGIVQIAASDRHVVGLKADGTVVAAGFGSYGQCDVHDWVLQTPAVKATQKPPAGQGSVPAATADPALTATPAPAATPTPVSGTQSGETPAPAVTPEPLPLWQLVPGYEMPVADAEVAKGVELKFVGILNIPSLNVKLPVQSTWSYEQLAYTPCRYAGTVYNNGFVIIAHRFDSHFAGIGNLPVGSTVTFTDMNGNIFRYQVTEVETLQADQTAELLSKDHALTLMTCTLSSSQRIVVRCERR